MIMRFGDIRTMVILVNILVLHNINVLIFIICKKYNNEVPILPKR